MVVSGWKGKVSVKLLIGKLEITSLIQLGRRDVGVTVEQDKQENK
jgi:hypothetical protein